MPRSSARRPDGWRQRLIDRLMPRSRSALAVARKTHPAILAAMYDIDIAQFRTKIAENGRGPTSRCKASRQVNDTSLSTNQQDVASSSDR